MGEALEEKGAVMTARVRTRMSGEELELWEDVPPGSTFELALQVMLERTRRLEQCLRALDGVAPRFLDNEGVEIIPR